MFQTGATIRDVARFARRSDIVDLIDKVSRYSLYPPILGRKEGMIEGRKEVFYLTIPSTHFIYCNMLHGKGSLR